MSYRDDWLDRKIEDGTLTEWDAQRLFDSAIVDQLVDDALAHRAARDRMPPEVRQHEDRDR